MTPSLPTTSSLTGATPEEGLATARRWTKDDIREYAARYGRLPFTFKGGEGSGDGDGGGAGGGDGKPGDENPDADLDKIEGLGDAGKKALKAEREARRAAEKAREDERKELEAFREAERKRKEESSRKDESEGKWEKLATERKAALETVETERDDWKGKYESAMKVLGPQVDADWKALPKEVAELYEGDDKDVLAKLAHIARTKPLVEKLKGSRAGNPKTPSDAKPDGSKGDPDIKSPMTAKQILG